VPRPPGKHQRFLEALVADPPEQCVTWPFARLENGYAVATDWRQKHLRRRPAIKAYRLAWELANGEPFPAGLEARHTCGEGARGCVNPVHIVPGTRSENRRDTIAMGRATLFGRGEECAHAKLTWAKVEEIRRLSAVGWTRTRLAEHAGCSASNISMILTERTWTS
jgi:hypothetical protein